jgi:hypothetical protein
MGRRELGDYRGKFNRKREFSIFDASTGVPAFLFLKNVAFSLVDRRTFSGADAWSWCIVALALPLSASGSRLKAKLVQNCTLLAMVREYRESLGDNQ